MARTYTASMLPNVGYTQSNFGRDFEQSQQALRGRTQRSYSLAGANAANQIGGSAGSAYRSLLGAEGATQGEHAALESLSNRQAQDRADQALRLQAAIAQENASANAFGMNEGVRRFDAEFGEGQRRFDSEFGEGRRRFDITTAEGQRQYSESLAQRESEFGRTFGEQARQYDLSQAQQDRQFNQSLGEGQRQFNQSQQQQILQGIMSNLTSLGFDALSNLPPETATLLRQYLGSFVGGVSNEIWSPTSGGSGGSGSGSGSSGSGSGSAVAPYNPYANGNPYAYRPNTGPTTWGGIY